MRARTAVEAGTRRGRERAMYRPGRWNRKCRVLCASAEYDEMVLQYIIQPEQKYKLHFLATPERF